MKKSLIKFLKYIIPVIAFAVLFTGVATHADLTPNFWAQNDTDVLMTNTPGGFATAAIHVGACYIGTGTGTPCGSGGSGTVTSIGTSSPITGGTITTTGTIGITQATTSTNGYLSSADWNTFNSKGSGTILGTAAANQVAFGSGSNTLTSNSSLTTDGSTFFQSLLSVGTNETGQVTNSNNILGAGVKGILIGKINSPDGDGVVSLMANGTSIGAASNYGIFGYTDFGAGGHSAQTQVSWDGTDAFTEVTAHSDAHKFVLRLSTLEAGPQFRVDNSKFYTFPNAQPTGAGQTLVSTNTHDLAWGIPAAPTLSQVLTSGATNSGISIQGTDFLKATGATTVLFDQNSTPIIVVDGNNFPSLLGGNNSFGFSSVGNPDSTGSYTTASAVTYTPDGSPALDDMTLPTIGNMAQGATDTITVTIDSTGPTDTFSWHTVAGPVTSGVPITGVSQSLAYGSKVVFGATTGHQLGDSWTYTLTGTTVTGLSLDYQNGTYSIGDTTSAVHGTSITVNDLLQLITVSNVPSYGDDAAATGAGLTTGQVALQINKC